MRAVILEGAAVNPGDISWDPVAALCETDIYETTDESNKMQRIPGHEIVLTNKVIIDEAVLAACPKIRYVGVCATGYNVVDLAAAKRHGVAVTNIPAYSTDSVAQMTIGMLIALASKIRTYDESVKRGDWLRAPMFCYYLDPVMELAGKTLGIYGFGHIGQKVAQIAQAMDMQVLVCTRTPSRYASFANETLRFVDAETLFAESDAITFHCPLTGETAELIRAENIRKMKPGVLLLNLARGGLVNEADLAGALKSGRVGGAGVDVVSVEPMREDNPLRTAPNILITPHIAWASREARIRLVDIAGGNLKGFLEGREVNRIC